MQIIDLRKSKTDFIFGSLKSMGLSDGRHFINNSINPQFEKLSMDSAFALYYDIYGDDVISITNGIFFETNDESLYTPMAYPIKYQGEIISSGVSPYAPNTGNYPLKVLSFEDSSVIISNYNYKNGDPLNDNTKLNQIVTLNYRHHPNVVEFPEINDGVKARYNLITAINEFGSQRREILLILTSTTDISIYQLAQELKKVDDTINDVEILTLDGGSSISIQDSKGTHIIKPLNNVKVPMYFGFRKRNNSLNDKIRIMNLKDGDILKSDKPYFIFWYSSIDIIKIELFQNDDIIARLSSSKAWNEGLFVWIPTKDLIGDDYRIKISNNNSYDFSGHFSIE